MVQQKVNLSVNWSEKYFVGQYYWRPSLAKYFEKYSLYIAGEWEFKNRRFITLWLLTIHDKASNSDSCAFCTRLPRWCCLNIFWLKWLNLADTDKQKRITETIFILIVSRNIYVEMNSYADAYIYQNHGVGWRIFCLTYILSQLLWASRNRLINW